MIRWDLPVLGVGKEKHRRRNKGCRVGNKLNLVEIMFLLMILYLCLSSVLSGLRPCDVLLELNSNTVSPSSFDIPDGQFTVCVRKHGNGFDLLLQRYHPVFLTYDYSVLLFTKFSECEVIRSGVAEQSGKTITEYRCKYETSDEDAKKCAYITKPIKKGKNEYAVTMEEHKKLSVGVFHEVRRKHVIRVFSPYKLVLSEFFKDSEETLLLSLRPEPVFLPPLARVYSYTDREHFYFNNSLSDRPANGELGDYQEGRHSIVKYSDPGIHCVPLDGFSCNCTVKERSMIKIFESRKIDFPKRTDIVLNGSDGAKVRYIDLYKYTMEVSLVTPGPDQRTQRVEKEEL